MTKTMPNSADDFLFNMLSAIDFARWQDRPAYKRLFDGQRSARANEVICKTGNVSAGAYFIRGSVDGVVKTQLVVIAR